MSIIPPLSPAPIWTEKKDSTLSDEEDLPKKLLRAKIYRVSHSILADISSAESLTHMTLFTGVIPYKNGLFINDNASLLACTTCAFFVFAVRGFFPEIIWRDFRDKFEF